ncbi:MAG: zinc ribbon domain-containing protein [bacterium]
MNKKISLLFLLIIIPSLIFAIYCWNCGAKAKEGDVYCRECGARLFYPTEMQLPRLDVKFNALFNDELWDKPAKDCIWKCYVSLFGKFSPNGEIGFGETLRGKNLRFERSLHASVGNYDIRIIIERETMTSSFFSKTFKYTTESVIKNVNFTEKRPVIMNIDIPGAETVLVEVDGITYRLTLVELK